MKLCNNQVLPNSDMKKGLTKALLILFSLPAIYFTYRLIFVGYSIGYVQARVSMVLDCLLGIHIATYNYFRCSDFQQHKYWWDAIRIAFLPVSLVCFSWVILKAIITILPYRMHIVIRKKY